MMENKEEKKVIYTIYLHMNKKTGDYYVGQTKYTPERRAGKMGIGYKQCIRFWRAIQYYGWENFETTILEQKECSSEEAGKLEFYYQNIYNHWNEEKERFERGYNINPGGDNGCVSAESKLKNSIANKGKRRSIASEFKKGQIPHNKGISPSDNVKQKISKTLTGRQDSKELKLKKLLAQQNMSIEAKKEKGKKISLALKNKPKSENHKKKLSLSKMGIPPLNKGCKKIIDENGKIKYIKLEEYNLLNINVNKICTKCGEKKSEYYLTSLSAQCKCCRNKQTIENKKEKSVACF